MICKNRFACHVMKVFSLGLLLACLTAVGCSDSLHVVPVEGKVIFQGEPLKFGAVLFQPEQGGQPACGKIQPDGTFKLSTFQLEDGAVVGRHKVRVTCYSSANSKSQKNGPSGEQPLGQLLIPRKYTIFGTSGLAAEVSANGDEPFEFRLTGHR